MASIGERGAERGGHRAQSFDNRILDLLPSSGANLLAPHLEAIDLERGQNLFEPGDELGHTCFPRGRAVVALTLPMRDGRLAEAATIGREGAIGNLSSLAGKPAFTRAVAQLPGGALRIPVARLDAARRTEPAIDELLRRYDACLGAQVLQSVGCAALHALDQRCARWLLMAHDRLQSPELPLTHEALAEMLGASRTYVTRIASDLQERGAIVYRRGMIRIARRAVLEEAACECYALVRRHFDAVLPGLYPVAER